MKVLSCGFVIRDTNTGKLLACHPTGRKHSFNCYDISKGHLENGENPLETAMRELKEETGLIIPKNIEIKDFGTFKYRPNKDLHLFFVEMPIDVSRLKCTSEFELNGRFIKEMDSFKLVDNIEYFFKSLQPIIKEIINDENI